ncbi:CRISPR-associated protein Cas5d [Hydrogenoanaerobacterium saccharovorans]|uniref:pre-crRNA processing endonuclease n=1 Tax=Hydrogenoanaerobacterium saccharovorans TaxID=474960 RepID=A0A1H8BGL2_9FIRM|nr:type I-C CRISPR-associated protein Cas5c [Hydrogenoanaerobacterium saccharovorans]RPF47417.1 CRISPR-associated protein Cas5d [Hydrogenoanaerobacterium saccharovorans]SEM81963.1 CRISPR-associated protein Cas5d [Hydrogenoanaerobacterium saccharovorans]
MSVKIEVWGDYACFTRPEMKVERVSYDVMTPSAARGLVEAIYWHPGLAWRIDRIYVLNPIRFTNIRRNEVKSKISAQNVRSVMNGAQKPLYISTSEDIQQRAAMVLKDVRYVIEAHFTLTDKANETDNAGKFQDIIKRRLVRGQCYHQPYFGCREFPANFKLFEGITIDTAYPNEQRDLGYMLYDMDYSNQEDIQAMFFRGTLKDGVVDLTNCEVIR